MIAREDLAALFDLIGRVDLNLARIADALERAHPMTEGGTFSCDQTYPGWKSDGTFGPRWRPPEGDTAEGAAEADIMSVRFDDDSKLGGP